MCFTPHAFTYFVLAPRRSALLALRTSFHVTHEDAPLCLLHLIIPPPKTRLFLSALSSFFLCAFVGILLPPPQLTTTTTFASLRHVSPDTTIVITWVLFPLFDTMCTNFLWVQLGQLVYISLLFLPLVS
jgi:hypothetical protein